MIGSDGTDGVSDEDVAAAVAIAAQTVQPEVDARSYPEHDYTATEPVGVDPDLRADIVDWAIEYGEPAPNAFASELLSAPWLRRLIAAAAAVRAQVAEEIAAELTERARGYMPGYQGNRIWNGAAAIARRLAVPPQETQQ